MFNPKSKLHCLIILLSILLVGFNTPASAETIRIFYYPPWNISKLPLYFARDTGLFERKGLQLSWTNPGSNEKLLTAMKNNEGDIFVASSNHVAQNNATGGPALIIVANTGYNYSVFLVDTMIKRPEDLRGKRIGTGEAGSTPDQLTRLALKRLGIDPDKDVTLVHFEEARSADRATALLSGKVSGSLVTAEAMYDLEKSGDIKKFHVIADHKKLNIYAGGGADYAISAAFLKNRREEAKTFLSCICEGIALAKKDKAKALEFVTKTVRKSDAAAVDYLYRLYTTEVIPSRPYPKIEGVDIAIQMLTPFVSAARELKAEELVDATLVGELEKEGRCNY